MKLHAILLTSALIPLMGADGGCGDPILENNGFDLWCGDTLCFWEVEEGSIEKIPTWHSADSGVEFVGNSVAISQAARTTAGCLRISAVANVAETAEVDVEIDFFDDGTIDVVERIPTTDWEPISLLVTAPGGSQGARFRIRKLGSGVAQLAELGVEVADKCVNPPVETGPRPLGATCRDNDDCASGGCLFGSPGQTLFTGVCVGCLDESGCDAGEVCGVSIPESLVITRAVQCVAPALDPVGAPCRDDLECASGVCNIGAFNQGVCGDCRDSGDCTAGAACVDNVIWPADEDGLQPGPVGLICDGSQLAGAPCSFDATCASGVCSGGDPLRLCEGDNRECVDDSDCYEGAACVTVGTSGGSCE